MDCAHYRRALLAEPHREDEELRLHVASCHDCTQYTDHVRRFESRLDRVLRWGAPGQGRPAAPAPASAAPAPALRAMPMRPRPRSGMRRSWMAAAASVLLAVVVAGGLWIAVPRSSLARDVVGHMADEPNAWARSEVAVPQPALDAVLRDSHLRLNGAAGLVTYASSCEFRGHRVPHLVVQTGGGPITVMVLTHEQSAAAARFDEHGYQGVIVPVPGHGSLAVLERGHAMTIEAVSAIAARVRGSIDWTS